jgi:orotate phosphoribosyltransferase
MAAEFRMLDYQHAFISFALERGALRFGEFTLKSGRQSPYFFNTGVFDSGEALARLGEFYAAALVARAPGFDMLFGPAYKGIPLATATAIALAARHGRDVPVCFNRKEVKDHGEGGTILGAAPTGRVAIVDDVISAGTSVNESAALLGAAGAVPCTVVIALDRQERGQGAQSAVQEVTARHAIPVVSIVTLADILHHLATRGDRAGDIARIEAYRVQYGIGAG